MPDRPAIILDCDPGHDDAMAIVVAARHAELLGITAVAGNAPLERTAYNARVMREVLGIDVPVHSGAERPLVVEASPAAAVHGVSGLDGADLPAPTCPLDSTDAVAFIIETCRQRDGVWLVPVGPLTNIALLAALRPELLPRIGAVAVMGGSDGHGNKTPAAEFNIWFDPESAARTFDSGLDLTMVGLNVTHKAMLTEEDVESMRGAGPIGAVAAAMLDHYLDWHGRNRGVRNVPVHDALAVAILIRPELVTTIDAHVTVDTTAGPARGMTLVDRYRSEGEAANALVAQTVDREAFVTFLCERIASLDRA